MKTTCFTSLLAALFCTLVFTAPAQMPPIPEVNITATVGNTTEGSTVPGVFTITRGPANTQIDPTPRPYTTPLRVYFYIKGTASNRLDYLMISNSVIIPAYSNSATVYIMPIQDNLVEGDETVSLTLATPILSEGTPAYYVGSQSNAVVTISDGARPVPIQVMIDPWPQTNVYTEPASFNIMVGIREPADVPYTVEVFEGTNSLGKHSFDPRVMYFADPLSWSRINLPAGTYIYTAVASNSLGQTGISERSTVTVNPSPVPVVTVVPTDNIASEIPVVPPGMGMPQKVDPAVFKVSRTGDTSFPMTVYYSLSGTASNRVDYELLPGSVTIPIGAVSAEIVVTPIDDDMVEGTESVTLKLEPIVCIAIYPAPPGCYVVGTPNWATASILDNDTNPPVKAPVVSVVATDPDAAEIPIVPPWSDQVQRYDPGVFTISRTGGTENPLTVFYFLAGTAMNGVDYERLSNYVVIPAGAATAEVVVSPIDDDLLEGRETVKLQLRPAMLPIDTSTDTAATTIWPPPYQVGSPSNAVVTIADDDIASDTNNPPLVQIVRPINGSSFRAPANILLASTANDFDGSVSSVEFFNGTESLGFGQQLAVLSSVYPNTQFTLVWSNVQAGKYTLTARATDNLGATTVSAPISIAVLLTNVPPITNTTPVVSITAVDSIASEGRFDFPTTVIIQSNLLCSTATGLGTTSAWVRLDPSVSNAVYWTNIYCGTNTATFEVRRSGPTNNALTVLYTIGGTAGNGIDYVSLPGTVVIPAGFRTAQIVVVPVDDAIVEGNETVILTLMIPPYANMLPPPYTLGSPCKAAAVILDNDAVLPPITPLPDGSVHVYLPAASGTGYRLETSSDLGTWTSPLSTIADGEGVHYIDPDTNAVRFYRLVPEPVMAPEQ